MLSSEALNRPTDRPNWLWPFLAFVPVLAVSASILLFHAPIDLWIYATSPLLDPGHRVNPLIGYSTIVNERIFHLENLPTLSILNTFLLAPPVGDFYAVRPMYPLIASIISPITGAVPALLIVNLASWIAASFCAIKLASMISTERSAPWMAMILIALGQGYWFHTTDFSAHIANHCGYIISVYILVIIGVGQEHLGFRQHAIATATMTAMALTYNSGLALVVVYLLFGMLSPSRFVYIANALLVVLLQRIWPFFYTWSVETGQFMQSTEFGYLAIAMNRWLALAQDPIRFSETALWHLLQIVASDPLNIAVLAISVLGLVLNRSARMYRVRLFLFAAAVAPIALALPWTTAALARGYISNAGYGLFAVLAAITLSELRPQWRYALVIPVLLQAAWIASALAGNVHPTKTLLHRQ